MEIRHLNIYFFFFVFILIGLTVFFIFKPFLTAIVAAVILSVIFRPCYNFFYNLFGGQRGLSSFLTCLLVILLIVTPLLIVFSLAIGEGSHLYQTLSQEHSFSQYVERSVNTVHHAPYLRDILNDDTFSTSSVLADLERLSENALGLLETAYQSITHFVFWVFVMFFTLFYFLIDGKRAFAYLMRLSPLRNDHEKLLAEKFISISRATLKGTLVIGVLQGLLGGIAFWIVGIESPAIWGLLMILFSIIPLVGAALIWFPAALIFLLLGYVWQGVFLLFIGFGVLSLLEHILRPRLVGKDTQMHPLMIFFATLGGISFFGLPGFIIGPILVSLFMALWEIYAIEFRSQLTKYNA